MTRTQVKHDETITILSDLIDRMDKAITSLRVLHNDVDTDFNRTRLGGKIDGVKLAREYAREELRILQNS